MNHTLLKAVFAVLVLVASGGCERPEPTADRPAEGRPETRHIRNVEAIGYGGDAIADKIDGAIEAQEQRPKSLEEALERQE